MIAEYTISSPIAENGTAIDNMTTRVLSVRHLLLCAIVNNIIVVLVDIRVLIRPCFPKTIVIDLEHQSRPTLKTCSSEIRIKYFKF